MLRKWHHSGVHYPRGTLKREAVRIVGDSKEPDYYIYEVVPATESGEKTDDENNTGADVPSIGDGKT